MSMIAIEKEHHLSHKKAKEAAEKVAEDLHARFDLEFKWKGDAIEFRRPGLTGALHVGKEDVRLDCQLGFMLSLLKPTIETEVHKQFDKYFGKAKRSRRAATASSTGRPGGRRRLRDRGDDVAADAGFRLPKRRVVAPEYRVHQRPLAPVDRRQESAAPRIFRNAAKPRSRKSCSTPKPATRAGCRIIASAAPINGFLTKTSRPAPISPISWIWRARAGASPRRDRRGNIGDRERAVLARQLREQSAVELLRQRVEFHRVRDRRDHALRQHPHQHRHDAREVGVAAREVRVAIEIGLEERDGRRITRILRQVRIGRGQALGLPRAMRASARATTGSASRLACNARRAAFRAGASRAQEPGGRRKVGTAERSLSRDSGGAGGAAGSLAGRQGHGL